jgi:flagellar hook-basal body complex protein FliE
MTIDPSFAVSGTEWRVESVGRLDAEGAEEAGRISSSEGFGDMLGQQMVKLQGFQDEAAAKAQALATGQSEDTVGVVMAAEKAKLSMQLAGQIRDKSVTALQELLRTQV